MEDLLLQARVKLMVSDCKMIKLQSALFEFCRQPFQPRKLHVASTIAHVADFQKFDFRFV